MKRTWVVVLVAVALAIPAIAVAEGPEPVAAWCGGSYGAEGVNFGECVNVEIKGRVAGASTGMKDQPVYAPTYPEYPANSVTFDDKRVVYDTGNMDRDGNAIKRELHINYVSSPDRSGDIEAPGD